MPFRRDKRRNTSLEVAPEPEPEPTQETLIPVVPESGQQSGQQQNTDLLITYVRFLGVFFLMFVVGILIGLGFSRGVHAVIITLSFVFSINGGIIYFYGFQRLRDQCLRCFNTNHDGDVTREDCRSVMTNRSTEVIICGISGFFIGILVGLLSF